MTRTDSDRGRGGATSLRSHLLRWVFSRTRWVNNMLVLAGFGLIFVLLPYATMHFLGVRASPEAAMLFRMYGIALVARAVSRYAIWGVTEPSTVLRGLLADLLFSTTTAALLTWAILSDLAGPTTWLVVGLFAVESIGYLIGYMGLRTVTREELEGALKNNVTE